LLRDEIGASATVATSRARNPAAKMVALVLNDSAGGFLGKPGAAEEIRQLLCDAHPSLHVFGAKVGGIEERLNAAMSAGADVIYVAGGDGTIAAAAQKLVGTPTALGVLPLGTMNLVAKDLNIPLDIAAAVRALADGINRQIDVGAVGEVVFLCNSVIGVAPLLARHRERERNHARLALHRWVRVALATLESLLRFRSRRLTVRYGENTRRLRTKALTISVNAYDEGPATLLRRSVLDGGELVAYIAPDVSALRLIGGMVRLLGGTGAKAAGLESHRLETITVDSHHHSLTVMNDGEPVLLPTPLHYKILPQALTVVVPRPGTAAVGLSLPISD
jgi:diacylglycerol kinase family enzyme